MFLTRNQRQTEKTAVYFLEAKEVGRFLEEFKNGHYSIVFHFEEESERLIYEAYAENPAFLPNVTYLKIEVQPNGQPYEPIGFPLSLEEKAFYVFLRNREIDLLKTNEKALESLYEKYSYSLAEARDLSEKELETRAKTRSEFIGLFSFSSEEKESYIPKGKWNLLLRIVPNHDNEHFLSFELSDLDGKRVPISSLSSFLESFSSEGNYHYRNESYSLKQAFFSESALKIITYLANLISFFGNYPGKDVEVSLDQFERILEMALGENVIYNGEEYYISREVKKAGFRYDKNDDISFVPAVSFLKNSRFLISKNHIIVFDDLSGVIMLHRFQNIQSKKLLVFFLRHKDEELAYVKDLIAKKAPRYLSLEEERDEEHLSINLYVDILEKGHLSFHSEYSLYGKTIKKEEVLPNQRFASAIAHYETLLRQYGGVEEGIQKDDSKVILFLKSDLSSLKKIAKVFLSDKLSNVTFSKSLSISLSLEHNFDWLSLKVKSPLYSPKEIEAILNAYRSKKKFILLKGTIILLDDPVIAELDKLRRKERLNERLESARLSTADAFRLAFREEASSLNLETDNYLKEAFRKVRDFQTALVELPLSFKSKLRPYQLAAVKWLFVLHSYGLGGILADDMGLGKTLEAISFLKTIDSDKPILIVSPKSVLYNWEKEFKIWDEEAATQVIDGTKEKRVSLIKAIQKNERKNYITSYDSLRNDLAYYEDKEFEVLISDESQVIKNFLALKSKAIRSIKAHSRFALTGTPIENSMADLWSIFDYLMPGYLDSFPIFKTRYIMAGNQEEARATLKKRITPFLLRRTKKEVLTELPPKSEEVIPLRMDDEARSLYQATLDKAKLVMKKNKDPSSPKDRFSLFYFLPVLTRLREISVDPSAFLDGFKGVSSKLSYLLDYAKSSIAGGHKLLVFSSFTKVLDHVKSMLEEEGISSYYIHGQIDGKKRLDMANSFNNENDVPVMLVSLKAGGTGLNLSGADIVIHLDPWWNVASEEQATDRAYRIGQARPVLVIKLICHDSIEEKVLALQKQKKELYDALIAGNEEAIAKLSEEDLEFLLS